MKYLRWLAPSSVLLSCLVACGDDTPSARTSFEEPAPVSLTAANRGLSLRYNASLRSAAALVAGDQEMATAGVIHTQVYAEDIHARVGETPRAPEPRIDVQLDEVYEDETIAPLISGFGTRYWVVDLQRLDREWLVDWNGLDRDSPDSRLASLTFTYRAQEEGGDYQSDVIERTVAAFEDADPRPESVIIGAEMERHYAAIPDDWPAFVSFARDLAAALRAVDPEVRVAVGFNWSNFLDTVVPQFVGAVGGDRVNYQAVQAAWDAVISPLYYDVSEIGQYTRVLDFYAFSSIPDPSRYPSPDALEAEHYAGIPTFFVENPERRLPVAWFALGWPVNSGSSAFFGDFLEFFLENAGGYETELVAWWGFSHLLSDVDCRPLTQTLELPASACFRGVYTSSGASVPGLRDVYFTDAP